MREREREKERNQIKIEKFKSYQTKEEKIYFSRIENCI